MKHLTILVPDGHPNPITIISTYMAFMQAEKHHVIKGGKPVFEKIALAGISKKVDVYNGLFSVTPVEDISEVRKTDLVIIPAFLPQTNPEQNIKQNKKVSKAITYSTLFSLAKLVYFMRPALTPGKRIFTNMYAKRILTNMYATGLNIFPIRGDRCVPVNCEFSRTGSAL